MIVVDDFYASPDSVRKFALAQEYTDFGGAKAFLGRETLYPYFDDSMTARFSELVGTPIVHSERQVYGKFRLAGADESRRTKVHFDRSAWAANIYLTPGLDASCGLGIYRHRATGLEEVPSAEQLADLGFDSLNEFDATVVVPDSLDQSRWELIDIIEPTYNRLVVIPGSRYFHAAEKGSGVNVEEARLSQHFFFQALDD
ncbi:hypothetical protein JOE38_002695 [Clavibacter michiganensis]|nr:hypothetical protein [Clavibacter michiganensis]